jgi:hypothetical protein
MTRVLRPADPFRGQIRAYDVIVEGKRLGQVRTFTGKTWSSVPLNGKGEYMPSLLGFEATPQAAALRIVRNSGSSI